MQDVFVPMPAARPPRSKRPQKHARGGRSARHCEGMGSSCQAITVEQLRVSCLVARSFPDRVTDLPKLGGMAAPSDMEDDDPVDGEIVQSRSGGTLAPGGEPPTSGSGATLNVTLGISATYASQLPPAADVERLERVSPGTLDRLIRLQERVAGWASPQIVESVG